MKSLALKRHAPTGWIERHVEVSDGHWGTVHATVWFTDKAYTGVMDREDVWKLIRWLIVWLYKDKHNQIREKVRSRRKAWRFQMEAWRRRWRKS
jgi:hypothetical protein